MSFRKVIGGLGVVAFLGLPGFTGLAAANDTPAPTSTCGMTCQAITVCITTFRSDSAEGAFDIRKGLPTGDFAEIAEGQIDLEDSQTAVVSCIFVAFAG